MASCSDSDSAADDAPATPLPGNDVRLGSDRSRLLDLFSTQGDGCHAELSGDGTTYGVWDDDCASLTRKGTNARFYTFTVTENSRVTIDLSSGVDTFLYLREGADALSGGYMRSDDDGGSSGNSRIREDLSPGTYTIEATTYSSAATGQFTLDVDFLAIAACGETLPGDGSVTGEWTGACDSTTRAGRYARFYTFTVTENSRVTIDLSSGVDTFLYLREGADALSGGYMRSDDDGGSSGNSRIREDLSPGTYTIEATTYSSAATGQFTLDVDFLAIAAQAAACGKTLPGDGSVTGEWTGACDSTTRAGRYARFYTFTVTENSRVTIDLSSGVDTYLYLREGADALSGGYMRSDDDGGSSGNSRIREDLSPGTYTIEATTYSSAATGQFTLDVDFLATAACGETLPGDGSVTGEWTGACDSTTRAGRYARFYTFTVTENSRVTIDLNSGVDTYLYLREGADALSGGYMRSDDDGGSGHNSRIREELSPGTYTIEATTYDEGRTGTFTLNVSGL